MNYTPTPVNDQKSVDRLREFLKANKLPASDLKLEGSWFVLYQEADGTIVGSGGLEQHGNTGLLRSVAVTEKLRGQALGGLIVEDIIAKAKRLNLTELYLLTETARAYFLKKGFQDVPREIVPEGIKQTTEFSLVCPVSAAVMKLTIHS